jgi:hypothetical protein
MRNQRLFDIPKKNLKLYLAYLPSLDTSTWPLTLHKERQHYADLRQKYIINPVSESENNSADDLNINNPLSLDQAVRI